MGCAGRVGAVYYRGTTMTLRVRYTHSTTHYARFLCACGTESENEFPVWGAELVYGRPDVPEGWTSRGTLPLIEYICPKCNQITEDISQHQKLI